mgnify:CR=1 FL=1
MPDPQDARGKLAEIEAELRGVEAAWNEALMDLDQDDDENQRLLEQLQRRADELRAARRSLLEPPPSRATPAPSAPPPPGLEELRQEVEQLRAAHASAPRELRGQIGGELVAAERRLQVAEERALYAGLDDAQLAEKVEELEIRAEEAKEARRAAPREGARARRAERALREALAELARARAEQDRRAAEVVAGGLKERLARKRAVERVQARRRAEVGKVVHDRSLPEWRKQEEMERLGEPLDPAEIEAAFREELAAFEAREREARAQEAAGVLLGASNSYTVPVERVAPRSYYRR